MTDKEDKEYIEVQPEKYCCSVAIQSLKNIIIENIYITYSPMNNSMSTTGHTLEGNIVDRFIEKFVALSRDTLDI